MIQPILAATIGLIRSTGRSIVSIATSGLIAVGLAQSQPSPSYVSRRRKSDETMRVVRLWCGADLGGLASKPGRVGEK